MPNDTHLDDSVEASPRRSRRRVRWIALGVGLIVVLIVGVLAGAQLGEPRLADSPLVGKPAPTFELRSLDSDTTLRNSTLSGRLYLVNYWASWCVPCREEAPVLQSFYERWSPSGVELIGIVYNDTEAAARRFRDEFSLSYPQVVDPKFESILEFGVRGIPETFIVDQRGIIMAHLIGAVREGTLDDVLEQIAGGEEVSDSNDRYQRP